MTTVSLNSSTIHTLVGSLKNGEKVVFTTFSPDDQTGATDLMVRIDPLKQIYAYHWGVKKNTDAVGVTVEPPTISMPTSVSSNLLVFQNATVTSSGQTVVTVMSIGV